MEALILILSLAGSIPGVRAGWIDFRAGRWIWGLLDLVGAIAAGMGLALFFAVNQFVPTGI